MHFWSWLKSFFIYKPNDSLELFRPKDRLIYRFWDGSKNVSRDPIALYKRLMAKGPELSIDIKVSNSASKDAGKAHDGVVTKVREIFDIKPLDENEVGLTELETVELLDDFLVWCERLKKNSRTPPTSSTPSAGIGPSQAAAEPISLGSDSGSTAGASFTADPSPSPTASLSPSA